jgi:hypothetical protein
VTAAALLLITVSALMHASWNYLAKSSRDKIVFRWATGVAGSALFLPLLWWTADGQP